METTSVWSKKELSFKAERDYAYPYTEVIVWVDLEGPGFNRRCFGFWDGGQTFRVRICATCPGIWKWKSGSDPFDPGLSGQEGAFEATSWSESDLESNPCRRGFLRATPNGHAFQYADGTPFFLLGDTWWPAGTFRYRWHDDEEKRPLGPRMGFKESVRYRKEQGYNSIAILAACPSWANDGLGVEVKDSEGTILRAHAWRQGNTDDAMDMHDEAGNRPFQFPGRVPGFEQVFPDIDRINPAFFQSLDRKIDYLNAQGFIPFIEPARRDIGQAWKKYYEWPDSYVRYVQYIWSRYQANNCLLSPIHFDYDHSSIPPSDWNDAANALIDRFGHPPFGTLVSANPSGSTLRNFGHVDKARWLTFHQSGNYRRHCHYEFLTEAFRCDPPVPCLNGEPYYDGYEPAVAEAGSEKSARFCRSGLYGSVLSGGLAGHLYGAVSLYSGDIEETAPHRIWEALTWESAAQMQHIREFLFSEGPRYQDLIPSPERLTPSREGDPEGYDGWAYCASTKEADLFLLYFEKDCPKARLRAAVPKASYEFQWYDPRTGKWLGSMPAIQADDSGNLVLPGFPDSSNPSKTDWAARLRKAG